MRQLEGFSLIAAEIFYRLPDYPRLLQSYIWQDYDLAPRFPKLVDSLTFWAINLDGPLYRVRVAHRRLIAPQEFRFVGGELSPLRLLGKTRTPNRDTRSCVSV